MPTYNRLPILTRVLLGLTEQTYPSECFEVVVVSDGSTDGTDRYLKELVTPFQLRAVYQNNSGPAAARNRGVQEAKGELILFLDDDVVPGERLVAEHAAAHERFEDGEVVIIGPMLTPSDFHLSPWVRWMQDRLGEQYHSMVSGEWEATARQFYTGNASLSRQLFLDFGGFDESLLRAEDVELAFRLADEGVKFQYCPDAAGFHYEQRSFSSWIGIAYAYGRNDVLFARQKGQEWLLQTISKEFKQRNPFIVTLVKLCLGRRRMSKLITSAFKGMLLLSNRVMIPILPRAACSSLFNLYYYQGVADELGGRRQFFSAGGMNDRG
jgi:GT2 family glycosyltransferase